MRRCLSCGTRLDPEWEVCWLCHAPVPADAPEELEPAAAQHVTQVDHVMSGPLGRGQVHGTHDPIAAPVYQTLDRRAGLFGKRGRVYATAVIVVLTVGTTVLFLPYVGYALTYGIFVTLLATYTLVRIWKGGRPLSRLLHLP